MSTDLTVANTIKEQLGRSFALLTGAKNFLGDTNSLSFRIPSTKRGINYVKITLNGRDLYDVTFGKIRGLNYTVVDEAEDVYFDSLQDVFENRTGLYCTLHAHR